MSRTASKGLERSKSAVRARSRNRITSNAENITPRKDSEVTLTVLGHVQVGKTALVSQFLWNGFVEDYRPTVEEFNWIEYEIGEEDRLMLQIIDSGGSRDFLAMRHLYIRTGDAFLVVFAVDDEQSFDEAKKIVAEIKDAKRKDVPLVLIANKIDKFSDETAWKVKNATEFALETGIPMLKITARDIAQVSNAFRKALESMKPSGARIRTEDLKKRRQSMPTTTRASMPGLDVKELERLKKRTKGNCSIM